MFGSECFTRGWTLQEIIAPKNLELSSTTWMRLGYNTEPSSAIGRYCGIDEKVLLGKTSVDKVNIAQRMRWASTRETSRVEDMAYCSTSTCPCYMARGLKLLQDCKRRSLEDPLIIQYLAGQNEVRLGRPCAVYLRGRQQSSSTVTTSVLRQISQASLSHPPTVD
jgi:hypothetical protein